MLYLCTGAKVVSPLYCGAGMGAWVLCNMGSHGVIFGVEAYPNGMN